MKEPRAIAVVAMPGVQLLDVSGPLDVFAEANVQAQKNAYRLLIVAKNAGHIRSSSGVRLVPDLVIGDATEVRIDTLLVAGCPNAADVPPDAAVVASPHTGRSLSSSPFTILPSPLTRTPSMFGTALCVPRPASRRDWIWRSRSLRRT